MKPPRLAPRLDLKIGFACNNRCDFCAQGMKRRVLPRRPLAEIREELERAAASGVRGVVFTGGEPTLHPEILQAVAAARGLGFKSIQIQSNGRRFAYPDFCRDLKAAGATEVSPSLHGSTREIHDALTGAPGAWAQVVSGIGNLKRAGFYVLTNTVVTAANCRDLPDLARLLVRLGVDQFQLAFVHIVGTAAEKARVVVPRKSEAVPFMREGLRIGREAGVRCYTEAVPFCLLPGFEAHVSESIIPDGPVVDEGVRLDSWQLWRSRDGKAKRPECGRCRYDAVCEGPWKEYPELYGWEEFVPVTGAAAAS